jgi:hypothetical protein
MGAVFLHAKQPRRISPPSKSQINSGRVKVRRLVEAFPDILSSETVGITDTWHGDDHCWAQHFSRVIDVNSISPFPPLVATDSPIREIHSAQVLTRSERALRNQGDAEYVSPRRDRLPKQEECELDAAAILERVADTSAKAEVLAERHANLRIGIAAGVADISADAEQLLGSIEEVVVAYNSADSIARRRWLRSLNHLVRKHNTLRRRRARLEAPLSEVALELSQTLELSRARVATLPPQDATVLVQPAVDHT